MEPKSTARTCFEANQGKPHGLPERESVHFTNTYNGKYYAKLTQSSDFIITKIIKVRAYALTEAKSTAKIAIVFKKIRIFVQYLQLCKRAACGIWPNAYAFSAVPEITLINQEHNNRCWKKIVLLRSTLKTR